MKKAKKLLFMITALFMLNSVYGQVFNGLKAYYPFGGNANDISGYNNNGTVKGTVTLTTDRNGTANCAYKFKGDTASYIEVNYSKDFDIDSTEALSISLWYAGGSTDPSDLEMLFNKKHYTQSPLPSDYHLLLYDDNFAMLGSEYDNTIFSTIRPPIPDTVWHHLVGTYNNKKWYLYEDDTLRVSDVTQTYIILQSTGNINIGRGFTGKIDDIRFYNCELAVKEVHQLFQLRGSCEAVRIQDTKLETILESRIVVFPNPANNIITIEYKTQQKEPLIIYNILGEQIYKDIWLIGQTQKSIDLSSFPKGIYIIRLGDVAKKIMTE